MNRNIILLAVTLVCLSAACAPAADEPRGPRDECGLIEPTDSDVEYALSFGRQAFTSTDWVKIYTVEPYKISLTRKNDALGGIAYLEYLIYNCGYTQTDLDNYFSDEGFDIIFVDYESHALANFCEEKSLALYEYNLVDSGIPYSARYWVKQATETRLLVMMLVFPSETPDVLDEYSRKIIPELTACP
jgi:hypothetical protein